MDALTFVSNMTAALAWPVVIAVSLWYFRKELKTFFNGMKRLKLGPLEAEMFELKTMEVRQLADAVAKVETPQFSQESTAVTSKTSPNTQPDAPRVSLSSKPDKNTVDATEDLFVGILATETVPRQMILKAWTVLEDGLRSLAKRSGLSPMNSFMTMLLDLSNRGHLSSHQLKVVKELHQLRGTLINTTLVATEDSAINFIVAAGSILKTVGVSGEPGRSAKVREAALDIPLPANGL